MCVHNSYKNVLHRRLPALAVAKKLRRALTLLVTLDWDIYASSLCDQDKNTAGAPTRLDNVSLHVQILFSDFSFIYRFLKEKEK